MTTQRTQERQLKSDIKRLIEARELIESVMNGPGLKIGTVIDAIEDMEYALLDQYMIMNRVSASVGQ